MPDEGLSSVVAYYVRKFRLHLMLKGMRKLYKINEISYTKRTD